MPAWAVPRRRSCRFRSCTALPLQCLRPLPPIRPPLRRLPHRWPCRCPERRFQTRRLLPLRLLPPLRRLLRLRRPLLFRPPPLRLPPRFRRLLRFRLPPLRLPPQRHFLLRRQRSPQQILHPHPPRASLPPAAIPIVVQQTPCVRAHNSLRRPRWPPSCPGLRMARPIQVLPAAVPAPAVPCAGSSSLRRGRLRSLFQRQLELLGRPRRRLLFRPRMLRRRPRRDGLGFRRQFRWRQDSVVEPLKFACFRVARLLPYFPGSRIDLCFAAAALPCGLQSLTQFLSFLALRKN